MSKEINLSEMVRDRANELRLRALLIQMLNSTNNNFTVVIKYITYLSNFLDFNVQAMIDIMYEILNNRYKPTIDEIIKINLLFGMTIKDIANKLNMKTSTIKMHIYRNKNNINTIVIYPRLKKEQLKELRNFFIQYSLCKIVDKITKM